MLRPVDAPVRKLDSRRVDGVDAAQLELREPPVVASLHEIGFLVAEESVHGPEERLHDIGVARAVRVRERVEARGRYASDTREFRRVAAVALR